MESYRIWSCVSGSLFVACFQGCSVVSHGSGLHFYCQMRFCLTQHLFKHTSVATPPQTDPIRVRGLGTEQVSLVAQLVKNPPAMPETWPQSLGWEDPLEKVAATYSSILAWRIPWTEEPGGLQAMGLQRVGHNSETEQQQLPLLVGLPWWLSQ